jgi:hypothetical protein
MKKVKIALLMIVMAVIVLPSCKKGKDDPFISFKFRDARVTAKWKLTKIEGTDVFPSGSTSVTVTTTYDGTIYTQTASSGGSATATGTYEMTIDKQGVITWAENYTPSSGTADVRTGTGSWLWVNSDKNKEFLSVDGGNNIFTTGVYHVDRCASKELVLHYTSIDVNNGKTTSYDDIYTFEKQ